MYYRVTTWENSHKDIAPDAYQYERISPVLLPINRLELQQHLRIDEADEQDSYLNLLLKTAVAYFENYSNNCCLPTQWRTFRNNLNFGVIELRKQNFRSLEKFQYLDDITGLMVEIPQTDYYIYKGIYYSQIAQTNSYNTWYNYPISYQNNSILIEFTAGMAINALDFESRYPELKIALLSHVAFLYENRGNDIGADQTQLSNEIMQTYSNYRCYDPYGGTIAPLNSWY